MFPLLLVLVAVMPGRIDAAFDINRTTPLANSSWTQLAGRNRLQEVFTMAPVNHLEDWNSTAAPVDDLPEDQAAADTNGVLRHQEEPAAANHPYADDEDADDPDDDEDFGFDPEDDGNTQHRSPVHQQPQQPPAPEEEEDDPSFDDDEDEANQSQGDQMARRHSDAEDDEYEFDDPQASRQDAIQDAQLDHEDFGDGGETQRIDNEIVLPPIFVWHDDPRQTPAQQTPAEFDLDETKFDQEYNMEQESALEPLLNLSSSQTILVPAMPT